MNSRYHCPGCGKPKVFTRYIDTLMGRHLPEQYGRCERLINCGYFLDPYKDGYSKQVWQAEQKEPGNHCKPDNRPTKPRQTAISFISADVYHKSRSSYDQNNFCRYLCSLFHKETAIVLMQRFKVGTSRYWAGATVFWQVDTSGQVRTGKVMLYNASTGKREKEALPDGSKRSLITWAHSALKLPDFSLQQCLFGLQQLTTLQATMPVAIVESEKTAIIATVYLPGFIWLACGSLTNLTREKLQPLAGRKIALFPDLGAFDKWQTRAREIQKVLSCQITVSDLLETRASDADKANGLDLADYLVKRDQQTGWALTDQGYPLFWDNLLNMQTITDHKQKLYRNEIIKTCKQDGTCNVGKLALEMGIDLQQAIHICEELARQYGYELAG